MSGEKTEQPTPKKLRDARKKGQVAKSQDVTSAALTVTCFFVVSTLFYTTVDDIQDLILLPTNYYEVPFRDAYRPFMLGVLTKVLIISLPLLLVVIVVGLAANFFQIGFMLTMEPIKPELKKLNPIEKFKQIFALKNFVEFLKSAVKVIVIGVIVFLIVKGSLDPLTKLPFGGERQVIGALKPMLGVLATGVSIAYIVIAAADFFFQKWQHVKQLKMSKDEVKREYKEMEGNPEIKSKRKQLHQEMAQSDTVERTRKSSVVVTNPTHLAIAIFYEEEGTEMPRVVAKGEDHVARRMVEVAKDEGIPVMQHVPLARALYEGVEIGRFVPPDLIEPLAEVLAFVQRLKKERGDVP
ncbi:MAG: type III secretion system export apparatus subunit SctU [Verrucomicrobiales bacterium]|jgi:type III secretion protein U|nr:type III secretion system export apparatus subunit SctU [bacterium]MDF2377661.1 type III secretion system export apparatus subunit SctU [Verrucomicrobiales bacterium]